MCSLLHTHKANSPDMGDTGRPSGQMLDEKRIIIRHIPCAGRKKPRIRLDARFGSVGSMGGRSFRMRPPARHHRDFCALMQKRPERIVQAVWGCTRNNAEQKACRLCGVWAAAVYGGRSAAGGRQGDQHPVAGFQFKMIKPVFIREERGGQTIRIGGHGHVPGQ